jgi:hypothetical protein
MEDYLNAKGPCHVCREEMTTTHAEVSAELDVFVCKKCLESAKQNFIWICVNCGNVYIRPKALVLKRLTDPRLMQAYRQCEDLQIIQGIDHCIECAPEEITEYVAAAKSKKTGGHC